VVKSTSVIFCLALILGIAGPAGAAQTRDPAMKDVMKDIGAIFEQYAVEAHVPGLVYGIVREGKLVKVQGIGVQDLESGTPVSADSVFRIASMTKAFTALAVLNLHKQGRLDLDSPAASIVPEFKVIAAPGQGAGPISLRQLLTHSAGLVTDDPWGDRQLNMSEPEFSRYLAAGIPLAQSPGEAFEYSNTGYAILGRAISNASGQRFQDYISQVLLQPLGMATTYWEISDVPARQLAIGYSWVDGHHEEQPRLSDGAYGAMGGLSTTAADYGRFVAWLLSAWSELPGNLAGTMDPATVREAGRGQVFSQLGQRPDGPDGASCPVVWMYGAGFYVVHDCELGMMLRHPGGLPGYGSQVLLLPREGVGIFAFANLTYAHLSEPVVEAAVRLKRAGLLQVPAMHVSPELQRAADDALQIYEAGDALVKKDELAINVLLDRSAQGRSAELSQLRRDAGTCSDIVTVEILHALAGKFRLVCEHGTVLVSILLSPTSPPKIQYLEFQAQEKVSGQ